MEMKEEKSLGDLFADLTRESSALIRQEINLAKAEMSQKAAKFGKDATTVAIGGFVAYAGALTLFASLVLVLVDFLNMAPSLAAFLVAVIALIGGGVMAMGG
ncbi:MAG: phage holin family protein, partial [Armatimonadetes bacterium]|nr:phage holin family protein [Armatimonadota bacterium]